MIPLTFYLSISIVGGPYLYRVSVRAMVLNATFNNISAISWLSVLLVKETRVPGEPTDLPQVTDKLYQTSFNKCRVSNYSNHVRGNIEKKENHYGKKK
jgi:hypothetical protein